MVFWVNLSLVKTHRFLPFCLAGLTLSMYSAAQGAPMPMGWTTFNGDTSPFMFCANHSEKEWHVTLASGAINISRSSNAAHLKFPPHFHANASMRGRTVVAKAGDGWLIGYDAGEFGGGLWWADDNGRKKKLTGRNVHAIISRGPKLLVFTGLDHMGVDEGQIYSYRPAPRRVGDLVQISNLGTAPDAALIDKQGTVLIAAQTRVAALDNSNHLQILFENGDMAMLYPNSIVEDQSGNVVVGMRFFVLQLQPRSDGAYVPIWYVPDKCSKIKVEGSYGSECVCVAQN